MSIDVILVVIAILVVDVFSTLILAVDFTFAINNYHFALTVHFYRGSNSVFSNQHLDFDRTGFEGCVGGSEWTPLPDIDAQEVKRRYMYVESSTLSVFAFAFAFDFAFSFAFLLPLLLSMLLPS